MPDSARDLALVLGGGGARGLAHIHVLEALDELGVRPKIVAGSSIGAVIGAGYASGMSGAEMREYALSTLGNRSNVLTRLWRLRPPSLRSMFSGGMPRLGEINPERALAAFLPVSIAHRFEDLAIPLKVTATDFYGNSLTVLESGPLQHAMAASIAIPGIFRPVTIGGRIHVDGGIANPVPFDLVAGAGRIVLAVDVVGMPVGDGARIPSRIEAAFGASQLMMQSITAMKCAVHKPDILIRPQANEFRVLDFLRVRTILERTRHAKEETKRSLERILGERKGGVSRAR